MVSRALGQGREVSPCLGRNVASSEPLRRSPSGVTAGLRSRNNDYPAIRPSCFFDEARLCKVPPQGFYTAVLESSGARSAAVRLLFVRKEGEWPPYSSAARAASSPVMLNSIEYGARLRLSAAPSASLPKAAKRRALASSFDGESCSTS